MKLKLLTVALVVTAWTTGTHAQSADEMYADGYVVVLGSARTFAAAEKLAKQIARKSHVRYDTLDRSLSNPDIGWCKRRTGDGDPDAKGYRRFVSVEYSSFYGLKRKFVIVGAVTFTLREARQDAASYRKAVPSLYIHKIRQYMGCRS